MRSVRVILLLAMGLGGAVAVAAEETTDWPLVITRLRRDLYQWPGNAQHREQLAVAYNNYGVTLGEQGQWPEAVKQFEEALRLEPKNAQFRQNLGNIYLNQAQERLTQQRYLDAKTLAANAVELAPESARAHALAGEVAYQTQQLKDARKAWERALELDPTQAGLRERLRQLVEELPVESQFDRLSQAFFDIRYEGEQVGRSVGYDIRDALLRARREVGSDFAYWPKYKLVVLVYSADSFRSLRQETPDWVAGQFDGKIRVPLPGEGLDQAQVQQILYHEYTHALVRDLAQGRCPIWFNEGLAEYEGRTQLQLPIVLLSRAVQQNRVVAWEALNEQFAVGLGQEQVGLAYEQAYSMVAYLVKRYGFWRLRRVLKAIGEGTPWPEVFVQEFHLKLPRIEQQWREWLPALLS